LKIKIRDYVKNISKKEKIKKIFLGGF